MKRMFNVTKISKTYYTVKTDYNSYEIYLDAVKGIGIYLNIPNDKSVLIKSYKHIKVITAINYLFNRELF